MSSINQDVLNAANEVLNLFVRSDSFPTPGELRNNKNIIYLCNALDRSLDVVCDGVETTTITGVGTVTRPVSENLVRKADLQGLVDSIDLLAAAQRDLNRQLVRGLASQIKSVDDKVCDIKRQFDDDVRPASEREVKEIVVGAFQDYDSKVLWRKIDAARPKATLTGAGESKLKLDKKKVAKKAVKKKAVKKKAVKKAARKKVTKKRSRL